MGTDPATSIQVLDNKQRQRYEIRHDGRTVGFAAYQRAERLIVFTHTEIEPALEGQGIGGQLVRAALDDVRSQAVPMLALCPFVQAWIQRHPEYADLDFRRPESQVTD
jgi:predicted GNAT family acetyltransferase